MKIGIIGCGVIGEATATTLEQRGYLPYRHDPEKGYAATDRFDIAFFCLPTPASDGVLDTSILEEALQESDAEIKVVRSTVPLGFMQGGVYMPSFMRERYPHEEWHPQFRVFAGDHNGIVAGLFSGGARVFHTDYRTAEFVKLALNAHLATQISFATEMSAAAKAYGIDWLNVIQVLKTDQRIGWHSYLEPGPFDGKCLPKDTANLQTQTQSTLLRAVLEVNDGNHHTRQLQEESHAISR